MKLEIKKPHWWSHHFTVTSHVHVESEATTVVNGDGAWDELAGEINKLLREGVEVYSTDTHQLLDTHRKVELYKNVWRDTIDPGKTNNKALLINITEIKVQSREEKLEAVLRENIENSDSDYGWKTIGAFEKWKARAKAALEPES